VGVLLALLSAIGFSFMSVFIRKGVRPGNADNGMLTTTAFSVIVLSSTAAILGISADSITWNTTGFLWFVAAGLSASLLGRGAMLAGIRYVGSSRTAAVKNTAPVVTVAVAILFLDERLSVLGAAGIGLAFFGLFLLILDAFKRDHTEHPREVEAEPENPTGGDTAGRAGYLSLSTVVIGTLLSVFAAVFFGLGQVARKVGIEYLPNALMGATIASWTALLAYLVIVAVRGHLRRVLRDSFKEFRPYFLLAGCALTVGQISFFAAITLAPVSYVSTIAASEALLTMFLATILIHTSENITGRIVVAAVAVSAGAAVIALS
jgi:drug/metabolite transporter (DMT)-like permease